MKISFKYAAKGNCTAPASGMADEDFGKKKASRDRALCKSNGKTTHIPLPLASTQQSGLYPGKAMPGDSGLKPIKRFSKGVVFSRDTTVIVIHKPN